MFAPSTLTKAAGLAALALLLGVSALAAPSYGELPLSFVPNAGQFESQVRFQVKGANGTIHFTSSQVVFSSDGAVVRATFVGAAPAPELTGFDPLPGTASFFVGDPARWRAGLPTFGALRYEALYPGIDLVYRGGKGALKREFAVAPGADPAQIRMAFSGVEAVTIDEAGDLVLDTAGGRLVEDAPVVFQEIGGATVEVGGRFRLFDDGTVGFEVGLYDPSHKLVIDPELAYSTYLGGGDGDNALGVAVDSNGNAYVTGSARSSDFPSTNPVVSPEPEGDVYIAKLNPSGSSLQYTAFLGGAFRDQGRGIAVDSAGNAYVVGETRSPNFPTVNSLDATHGGGQCVTGPCPDAFVAKLNASGTQLAFTTFLGGGDVEFGNGIALDRAGRIHLTGQTASDDFPVNGLFQQKKGARDAFYSKLDNSGSTLLYSTFLGGNDSDDGHGIAVDPSGNAYVAGETRSTDFPVTTNALQTGHGGGALDGYVTKFQPNGLLAYSTYLGGSNTDFVNGIVVDGFGSAFVAGYTGSNDYPTVSPVQANLGGQVDAFVSKLNAAGSGLVYSTYLGGSTIDFAQGIAVDGSGNAYVTGVTDSSNFPTADPVQPSYGGGVFDAFVAKLNRQGFALAYSTFLGGTDNDQGYGIAVDTKDAAYVAGTTASGNFPVTGGAYQVLTSSGGVNDAFVTKLAEATFPPPQEQDEADMAVTVRDNPDPVTVGDEINYTVEVRNNGPAQATGVLLTSTMPGSLEFVSANTNRGSCGLVNGVVVCELNDMGADVRVTVSVVARATQAGTAGNTARISAEQLDPEPSNDNDTATTTVQGQVDQGENEPPTVSLSYAPQDPTVNDTVEFEADATDPDGDELEYAWIVDGQPQDVTGPTARWTNPPQGAHTVTVRVSDGNGGQAEDTVEFTVGTGQQEPGNQEPTVSLSYTPGSPEVGNPVQLNAQASDPDGDPLGYSWTVNGQPRTDLTGASPTWTPSQPGSYTVQVQVADGRGGTASDSRTISVSGGSSGDPSTSLAEALDANDNGVLDDSEIENAITLWVLGDTVPGTDGETIGDDEMIDLIAMWITGASVSSDGAARVASPRQPLRVEGVALSQPSPLSRTVRVRGQNVARIEVQVFGLDGRLLIREEHAGPALRFNLLDGSGRPLANGVYLYAVTARGTDGTSWRSAVQKVVVLR